MNHDMAELLLEHLREQTQFLQSLDAPFPSPADEAARQAFAH